MTCTECKAHRYEQMKQIHYEHKEKLEEAYQQGRKDAEPKKGKWGCEGLLFFCSECGKSAYPSHYCPNCGADMRGGKG